VASAATDSIVVREPIALSAFNEPSMKGSTLLKIEYRIALSAFNEPSREKGKGKSKGKGKGKSKGKSKSKANGESQRYGQC